MTQTWVQVQEYLHFLLQQNVLVLYLSTLLTAAEVGNSEVLALYWSIFYAIGPMPWLWAMYLHAVTVHLATQIYINADCCDHISTILQIYTHHKVLTGSSLLNRNFHTRKPDDPFCDQYSTTWVNILVTGLKPYNKHKHLYSMLYLDSTFKHLWGISARDVK